MKEPKSKLPWKLSGFEDKTLFIDGNSEEISIEDSFYIIQACNNFPEAIKLLTDIKNYAGRHQGYEEAAKINDFLKSLEE